jgi:hypothetical protein
MHTAHALSPHPPGGQPLLPPHGPQGAALPAAGIQSTIYGCVIQIATPCERHSKTGRTSQACASELERATTPTHVAMVDGLLCICCQM